MITIGIIGATGYTGAELVRLLLNHPEVKNFVLSSVSFEGQDFADIYPNFANRFHAILGSADEVVEKSDVIFTALPHGLAEQYAVTCLKKNKKLIDLSADFRYGTDEETFQKWYKKSWSFPKTHAQAVYGLPELNRKHIRKASIIGNPGCYVTSVTIGLLPILKKNLIKTKCIIIDSKSGVTGAGRTPTATNQFCECGESFAPYAIGSHRHQSEIEHNLAEITGQSCSVVFTPHLLPMSRGIISTIYAPLKKEFAGKISLAEIHTAYSDFYKDEPFVRVLPLGKTATTKNVRLSNYCDISLHLVHDGTMLEIIAALDNMVKGASGQAVQNMNIMCGFPETTALEAIASAF